jgi:hypothetical protein
MNCHHSSEYTSGSSLDLDLALEPDEEDSFLLLGLPLLSFFLTEDLELEPEPDLEPESELESELDHSLLLLGFTPLISPLDEDSKELEEPDPEEEFAAGLAEAAALAAGLEDGPMSLLLTEGFVYRF